MHLDESIPIRHVVPPHSAMDHDLVHGECWCRPDLDIRHDHIAVLHKADGRWRAPEQIPLAQHQHSTICTASSM